MFFVESEEEIELCPNCGTQLIYQCRVARALKNIDGKKDLYNIRVMKCENKACPTTYHRELPNIIIPYMRYSTETIEKAISQSKSSNDAAADNSTIQRWKKWFESQAAQIILALISVTTEIGNNEEASSLAVQKDSTCTPIEKIQTIVSRKEKWLNEAVRILVNSSKWVFNRSAWLSG